MRNSPVFLGISGVRRNASAALWSRGTLRAACEQERLTRVRAAGLEAGRLPEQAVDTVLALSGTSSAEISAVVVAESDVRLPEGAPTVAVDHHRAHAATAFLTSGLSKAAVLVCDRTPGREVSVWVGNGARLHDEGRAWRGRGFASLYAECAEIFGVGSGEVHKLEALARLGRGDRVGELRGVLDYADGVVQVARDWKRQVHDMIRSEAPSGFTGAETASAVQRRIGELLLALCGEVAGRTGAPALCLGGGLFYNTFFTSLIRQSGVFEQVFVPINPGNAGLAVGAAMMLGQQEDSDATPAPPSPFLGPEYSMEAIKTALDECKLSYALVSESEAIDTAVDAVVRGQLVGWFQGRMEWGHRALGHRSILADPCSPYALDNLNLFLRKRERWRSFGVSVRAESAKDVFCGPGRSPYMEFEYGVRDDRLRHIMPNRATSIRVQTVSREDGPFWEMHRRMEQATGTGVLVNTSLNGFNEPIACSPRDAVRVFYGTGLDLLVIGRFVLRK